MTEREKRLKEMEKLDRQLEAKGVNTKNRAGEPIEVEKRKTTTAKNSGNNASSGANKRASSSDATTTRRAGTGSTAGRGTSVGGTSSVWATNDADIMREIAAEKATPAQSPTYLYNPGRMTQNEFTRRVNSQGYVTYNGKKYTNYQDYYNASNAGKTASNKELDDLIASRDNKEKANMDAMKKQASADANTPLGAERQDYLKDNSQDYETAKQNYMKAHGLTEEQYEKTLETRQREKNIEDQVNWQIEWQGKYEDVPDDDKEAFRKLAEYDGSAYDKAKGYFNSDVKDAKTLLAGRYTEDEIAAYTKIAGQYADQENYEKSQQAYQETQQKIASIDSTTKDGSWHNYTDRDLLALIYYENDVSGSGNAEYMFYTQNHNGKSPRDILKEKYGYSDDELTQMAIIAQYEDNKITRVQYEEAIRPLIKEHPYLAYAVGTVNIMGGWTNAIGIANDVVDANRLKQSGYEGDISLQGSDNPWSAPTNLNAMIAEENGDKWGGAYGATMNAINNTLTNVAMPGVGGAVNYFGSGAATGIDVAKANGADLEHQLLTAGAYGANEMIFEKLSWGSIGAVEKYTGGVVSGKNIFLRGLNWLGRRGVDSLINGSEEVNTDLANDFADHLINGDKSKYGIMANQMLQAGYSADQIEDAIAKDAASNYWETFKQGVAQGFIMGGMQSAQIAVQDYNTGRALKLGGDYSQQSIAQRLVEQGYREDQAQTLAKDIGKLATGSKSSSAQERIAMNDMDGILYKEYANASKAAQANTETVRQTAQELGVKDQGSDNIGVARAARLASSKVARDTEISRSDLYNELREQGVSRLQAAMEARTAKNISDKQATGEQLTKTEQRRFVSDEKITAAIKSAEQKKTEANQGSIEKLGRIASITDKMQVDKVLSKTGATVISDTGETVQSYKITDISRDVDLKKNGQGITDIKTEVTLADGSKKTVALDELEYSSSAEARAAEVVETAIKRAEIDTATANFVLRSVPSLMANHSVKQVSSAVVSAYNNGRYDIPMGYYGQVAQGVLGTKLYEAIQQSGAKAVENMTEMQQAAVQKAIKAFVANKGKAVKGKVMFRGKILNDMAIDSATDLSDAQRDDLRTAQIMADVTGLKIVATESTAEQQAKGAENGSFGFRNKDGEYVLYVDMNAGEKGQGITAFTLAHELTHFIKEWSPAQFNNLAKFVMDRYNKENVDVEGLINQEIRKARAMNESLSRADAYEEVICNAMQTMLTDDRKTVVNHLAEMNKENPGLFKKLRNEINRISDAFTKKYKQFEGDGSLDAAGKYIADAKDTIDDLRMAFAEALHEAGQNFRAAGGAELAKYIRASEAGIQKTITKNEDRESKGVSAGDISSDQLESGSLISTADLVQGPADKQQIRTDVEPMYKQQFTILSNGKKAMLYTEDGKVKKVTVKELRNNALREFLNTDESFNKMVRDKKLNKQKEIEKRVKNLDKVFNETQKFLEDVMKDNKYTFVGLQDCENQELIIRNDENGNPAEIVLTAMVNNGEYEVNFDFTKVCERRQALQGIINELTKKASAESGKTQEVKVNLTQENIFAINKALSDAGIDTACLICFVESKRYNIQSFYQEKFIDVWNEAVKEEAKKRGIKDKDIEYFRFAERNINSKEGKLTPDEIAQAEEYAVKWRENKASIKADADAKKESSEEDDDKLTETYIKEYVKQAAQAYFDGQTSGQAGEFKLLQLADLVTEDGRTRLHRDHGEIETLIGQRLGTSAPKSVEAYTPYNGEIELLQGGTSGKTANLQDYLFSIGGIRSQSFSDYVGAHLYDVLQKTCAMSARGFPAHTYTKEIYRAILFGMTGEKINLSAVYEIRDDVDSWEAGLRYNENGELEYAVSDYDAKKSGKADWNQSIRYKDAVALQNIAGYSKNCGIIGVGHSWKHSMMMQADPDVRMIIGYHRSSLPVVIAELSHIEKSADYTNVQNTLAFNGFKLNKYKTPDGVPSYATPPGDAKTKRGKFAPTEFADEQALIDRYNKNCLAINPRYKTLKGEKKLQVETDAAVLTLNQLLKYANDNNLSLSTSKAPAGKAKGHEINIKQDKQVIDSFHLYEDLAKTKDPYLTAQHYIRACIKNGMIPEFYEFTHTMNNDGSLNYDYNYYKNLYDFNVIDRAAAVISDDGRFYNEDGTVAYAPQEAVNVFDEDGNVVLGGEEWFKQVDASLKDSNTRAKAAALAQPKIIAKLANQVDSNGKPLVETIKRQTRISDEEYMDAVKNNDQPKLKQMVKEAAKNRGYTDRTFHGTRASKYGGSGFGFTTILSSAGQDGRSFFMAGNLQTAQTYSSYEGIRRISASEEEVLEHNEASLESVQKSLEERATELTEKIWREVGEWRLGPDDLSLIAKDYMDSGYSDSQIWERMYEDMIDAVADSWYAANDFSRDGEAPPSDTDFAEWQEDEGEEICEMCSDFVDATIEAINMLRYYDSDDTSRGNYEFYVNTDGWLEIEGNNKTWSTLDYNTKDGKILKLTRQVAEDAFNNGYRGVIIRSIYDFGGQPIGNAETSDIYISFYPQQDVKSADPITYDDNGNVIPLSERFNAEADDIRYQGRTENESAEKQEALEKSDAKTKFSVRHGPPPKETITAYKVFIAKNGKLYPPMVNNPSGKGTPVGVWLNADTGELARDKEGNLIYTKTTGRLKVENRKNKSSPLAWRPGWHLGAFPDAKQFAVKNPVTGKKDVLPENLVFAKCEIAADVDYQLDAFSYGVDEKGSFDRTQAGLPFIPYHGFYKYRTNPDPQTAPWYITGAMKVTEILTDEDCRKICAEFGVTPMPRRGGDINLEDFGLKAGAVNPTSEEDLADIPKGVDLSDEIIKLPGYTRRPLNFADNNLKKEFEINGYDENKIAEYEQQYASEQERYKYDTLVSKDDMHLATLSDELTTTDKGTINRGDLVEKGIKNVKEFGGTTEDGEAYVHVEDNDKNVRVSIGALRHGLHRKTHVYKLLTPHIGEILKNSIQVNEFLIPKNKNAHKSYMLLGAGIDESGRIVPVDFIVNSFTNEIEDIGFEDADRLYSLYKKEDAVDPKDPELRQKLALSLTTSTIKISDLLDVVKSELPRSLSKDVLNHFNMERGNSEISEKLKYQQRSNPTFEDFESSLSQEELADIETEVDNRMLNEDSRIAELNTQIADLTSQREELMQNEKANRDEIVKLNNRITILQNRLEKRKKQVQSLKGKVKRRDSKIETLSEERRAAIRKAVVEERRNDRYHDTVDKQHQREQIAKITSTVAKKLTTNGDPSTKHVPDALKNSIIEFANIMNGAGTFGKQKAQRLDQSLTALANALSRNSDSNNNGEADANIMSMYDEDLKNTINELAEKIGDRKLRKLSSDELREVKEIAKYVRHIVTSANKAFSANIAEGISELSDKSYSEIRNHKQSKVFATKVQTGMLKPVTFFDMMGSPTLSRLYDNIRQGELSWYKVIDEAKNFRIEAQEKHHYKDWADDTVTVKLSSGDLELTMEEALSLYATIKRSGDQGINHLMQGGFTTEDSVIKKNRKNKGETVEDKLARTSRRISYDEAVQFADSLTDDQRAYADELVGYMSNDMANLGNEVSLKLYGIRKFMEEYYFPLSSNPYSLYDSGQGNAGDVDNRIKHLSMTNPLIKNANNPIIIGSFTETCMRHCSDMGLYYGLCLPMEDFNRVYNSKGAMPGKDSDTSLIQANLKNEIARTFITKDGNKKSTANNAIDYISNLRRDINGRAGRDPGGNMVQKMVSLTKKNAVFGSMSVAVQQPSAIARAFRYISPKYFVETTFTKRDYDELKKWAPVAGIKEMGYFDTGVGMSKTEWMMQNEYEGIKEKTKALFTDKGYRDEALSKLPSVMDEVTWAHIWNACKAEIADTTDLKKGTDEFYKAAADRFTYVIDRTQVYDSVFSRSQWMRSKDTGASVATAFMAEPTTAINMLYNAAYGKLEAGESRKAAVGKALGAFLSSVALNSALKSLVTAARHAGKDDEKDKSWWEIYINEFIGNAKDDLMPFNYIPYAKDAWSLFQGYSTDRMDTQAIALIVKAYQKAQKEGFSYESIKAIAGAVGICTGIPFANIMKDIEGATNIGKRMIAAYNGTGPKTTPEGLKYSARDAVYEPNKKKQYNKLIDSYTKGNEDKADSIEEDLRYHSKNGNLSQQYLSDTIEKKTISGKMTQEQAVEALIEFYGYKDGGTEKTSPEAKAKKKVKGWFEED